METKVNKLKTKRAGAFTLIELLVVIAIIGIIAALIANLSGSAAIKRKINRVTTEMAQLETAIDSYKEKKGFYPPSNGDTNNVFTNQLFYELSGTKAVTNNQNDVDKFATINGSESITPAKIQDFFKINGFVNSSVDKSEVKNFFAALKSSQYQDIDPDPDDEVHVLVVPVEGPNDITINGKKINPWRYNSRTPAHNPESYDLWAEIVVGGKTNIIGNWKE